MKPVDFKKWLPHLIILAGMAIASLLFAYPAAFNGLQLQQHDNISWQGMSQEVRTWDERTGEHSLWSNSMFGGGPTYTYYMSGTGNALSPVYTTVTSLLVKPANFLFLAMLCFYVLGSVLRWNRWLRVAAAAAFAFSSYNLVIIGAGHETKMFAIAFMPAVLAGFLLLYRGRYLPGAALFGVPLALSIMTGHYQIVYYLGIALIIGGVGLAIQAFKEGWLPRFATASAVALVAGGLAAGSAAVMILPTKEYNELTMRGGRSELTINKTADEKEKKGGLDKNYAFSWSNGIGETFDILIPYLHGGSSSEPAEKAPETDALVNGQYPELPLYWGPQPFLSGPVYFGAVICFLAVLGMFVIRSPHKWWMAAACLLAIVMSWGKHFAAFNYFLFDTLPLLKNFRTPSMVLVIPQLLFPVLAAWGLNDMLTGAVSRQDAWKAARTAGGITMGLCLLLGVLGGIFFDFTGVADAQLPAEILSTLKDDRAALARNSALLSAFWIAATAALVWAWSGGKVKDNVLAIGVVALVLIDLLPVATHYLSEDAYAEADTYNQNFQPRPVDQQILQDKDPYYRVLDLSKDPYNDAVQAYFHKAVGGYSPAKLERYQDLIDVHLSPQKGFNSAVVNMLNTKYIISPAGPGGQLSVFPNPGALGNAWFVQEAKLVPTADAEMLAMAAPALGDTAQPNPTDFNPRRTAVIRNSFASAINGYQFGADSAATVKLARYGLNKISYASSNSRPGLAVFSDIWYPHGWRAFIDGKEEPILCANYVLRALKIPAGQHTIEFRFEPQTFAQGKTITTVSSLALILLAITGLAAAVLARGKRSEVVEATTAADTPARAKR